MYHPGWHIPHSSIALFPHKGTWHICSSSHTSTFLIRGEKDPTGCSRFTAWSSRWESTSAEDFGLACSCSLCIRWGWMIPLALVQKMSTVSMEEGWCFWGCISGSLFSSFGPAGHSSLNAKALRFN